MKNIINQQHNTPINPRYQLSIEIHSSYNNHDMEHDSPQYRLYGKQKYAHNDAMVGAIDIKLVIILISIIIMHHITENQEAIFQQEHKLQH